MGELYFVDQYKASASMGKIIKAFTANERKKTLIFLVLCA